jgi:hypothetical protein
MPNTLHRLRPFVKFHSDRHFIYITAQGDEHKEKIQSYYKIIEEDMEEITKEWPTKFLIPVNQEELFDPDLIDNPVVTCKEYDAPNSRRRKNRKEVQYLNNTSKETASDSPRGGRGDELDKEENDGK